MEFKAKLQEYRRVLQITKKPDVEEFKGIVKITSIGVAIIGLAGFIVSILYALAVS